MQLPYMFTQLLFHKEDVTQALELKGGCDTSYSWSPWNSLQNPGKETFGNGVRERI